VERYRAVGHWYYIHHLDSPCIVIFLLDLARFALSARRYLQHYNPALGNGMGWLGSLDVRCRYIRIGRDGARNEESLLMLGGLLATLKLPILLPLGAALGGIGARFVRF
jgi:hypothetical protein